MKKFYVLIMTLIVGMFMTSCTIDFNDGSHDDDYIKVDFVYEVDEQSGELVKSYYVWELVFYSFGNDELENVGSTNELSYTRYGYIDVYLGDYVDLYATNNYEWVNIPETAWYESNQKLPNDTLVLYGTLPVLSPSYEIGDSVRVYYLDNNLALHYMVVRSNNTIYVRYGDLRKLVTS